MTPQERAEKILAFVDSAKDKYLYRNEACFDFIAAQITEAEREAERNAYRAGCNEAALKFSDEKNKAYIEGFSTARENLKKEIEDGKYKDLRELQSALLKAKVEESL